MKRLKCAHMANQKLATEDGVLQVDENGFLETEDKFVQAFLNSGFKLVAPLKKPEPKPEDPECPEELKTVPVAEEPKVAAPREAKDADPVDLSEEDKPKFKRKESDPKWQRSKQ